MDFSRVDSSARTTKLLLLAHSALWALICILLIPAITAGGFWWTDESRHAMGGVFILDLIRDMPLADPMGYAMRYFAQYPALALNWYLPGFYVVEAIFFSLFGISEPVAHWTVIAFCTLAASLWFDWARRTWGVAVAFLSTALFLSMPSWNLWGRSVMLEVPAIAMFILAVSCFERYLDKPELPRALVAGVAIAAALIFKQTVALLLPGLVSYALWTQRRTALWRWDALPAYLIVIATLAIVGLHAVKFGNLGLAATLGDSHVGVGGSAARLSVERWLLYPNSLVETWGWPLLALSIFGAVLPTRGNEPQLPLLYFWLACWYIMMTLLLGAAGNAPRYTLYVFPVLAVFAARPVFLLWHNAFLRNIAIAVVLFSIGFNTFRSFVQVVPHVDGYRDAAEFIHKESAKGPIIFAGKHDGSFIFHLRTLDNRRNEVILRADKILVSHAVHKFFGMPSHVQSLDDIHELIDRYGVEFVLVERPDLVGIKEFEMLNLLLQGPSFEKIRTQSIVSGGGAMAPERIEIYRYLDRKPAEDAMIVIPLPHLQREIRFKR